MYHRYIMKRHELSTVGKPMNRTDAVAKVTGSALYVDDMRVPGCLFGKTVLSSHSHARIRDIDVSEASGVQDVIKIITAMMFSGTNEIGVVIPDQPLLCHDRVPLHGRSGCADRGRNQRGRARGRGKLNITYEPLPGVFDAESSRRPDAEKIHADGNEITSLKIEKGDTAKAMLDATYRVRSHLQQQETGAHVY